MDAYPAFYSIYSRQDSDQNSNLEYPRNSFILVNCLPPEVLGPIPQFKHRRAVNIPGTTSIVPGARVLFAKTRSESAAQGSKTGIE